MCAQAQSESLHTPDDARHIAIGGNILESIRFLPDTFVFIQLLIAGTEDSFCLKFQNLNIRGYIHSFHSDV